MLRTTLVVVLLTASADFTLGTDDESDDENYGVIWNWNNTFSPCIESEADLVYENGELSVLGNFMKCVGNIVDAPSLPVLYNGSLIGTMLVNSSIQLNNLHGVDELSGTITIDFYWRVFWHDKRFNMPVFWERIPDYFRTRGLDVSRLKDFDTGTLMWIPDVRFHDATDMTILVEGIRMNEDGRVFWTRHVVATFQQPFIDITDYPSDFQFLNIRYGSYVYDSTVYRSGFLEGTNPISLNSNFDGTFSFNRDSLWTYRADKSRYGFYYSGSSYHNTVYRIYLERQGSGIIIRLILPMTLLIMLGGVTFWASPDNRVDSTTTLLLAVSALYIVILGNIPLVGYLTNFDEFVFWMFLLLIAVAAVHQVYSTLNQKLDIWPIRRVYLRLLQAIGRVGVIPIVMLFYLHFVHAGHDTQGILWRVVAALIILLITCIEAPGVKRAFRRSLLELEDKFSNMDTKFSNVSKLEILVINFVRYKEVSFDFERISTDLKKKNRLSLLHVKDVNLTDTATIRNKQHRPVVTTEKFAPAVKHFVKPHNQLKQDDSDDEDFKEENTGGIIVAERSFYGEEDL